MGWGGGVGGNEGQGVGCEGEEEDGDEQDEAEQMHFRWPLSRIFLARYMDDSDLVRVSGLGILKDGVNSLPMWVESHH